MNEDRAPLPAALFLYTIIWIDMKYFIKILKNILTTAVGVVK